MKIVDITTSRLCLLIGILSVLLLSSCADDGFIESEPQIFQLPEAQELVSATLSGRIIDEDDQPVMGANVVYLSGRTLVEVDTDEFGSFLIEDVSNNGKAAFISVTQQGKFEAFRKFSLVPNRYNYTEVKMLNRTVIGSIDALEGGRLTMNNRSAIELPKGAVVTAEGSIYEGDVDIAMSWIDPSGADLAQRMIGDLSGLDEDGNFRSLSSMGMLQVELSDAAGNELNIGPGETAELTFPIPASLMDKAKSTIPLWSYNEDIGTWIQEGTADKKGDFYVARVSHFSSWNVDYMTDPIEISGKVLIQTEAGDDTAGSYLQVYVCSELIGRKGGWLCDDGSFRFYNFPKGEKFRLKVLDACGDEIFGESFGPLQNDEVLETITIDANQNMVNVKGLALTCEGEAISNGALSIQLGDKNFRYPIEDNGVFDFTIDFCSEASADMTVLDLDNLFSEEIAISGQDRTVDVGELRLCDALSNFMLFQVNGREASIFQPVRVDIVEVDTIGVRFYQVDILNVASETDIETDSVLVQRALITIKIDTETLELEGVSLISFTDETFLCSIDLDISTDVVLTLTEVGVDSGSVIAGTLRSTATRCFDWFTGESFEGEVMEGEFSVIVD